MFRGDEYCQEDFQGYLKSALGLLINRNLFFCTADSSLTTQNLCKEVAYSYYLVSLRSTLHREGLPRPSLAVRENAYVVSIQNAHAHWLDMLKDLTLVGGRIENSVVFVSSFGNHVSLFGYIGIGKPDE